MQDTSASRHASLLEIPTGLVADDGATDFRHLYRVRPVAATRSERVFGKLEGDVRLEKPSNQPVAEQVRRHSE